jgi:hypothetical protein
MAEKLKIVATDDGVEIIANREGLNGLADICQRLSMLAVDGNLAKQRGNHYHYAASFSAVAASLRVFDSVSSPSLVRSL